jgi:hypothetical protein
MFLGGRIMDTLKNNRNRGKMHQWEMAKRFGGVSVGTLGKADVITEDMSIECKSFKRFTGFRLFEQAVRHAGDKIPVLIVHLYGKRYDDDLFVIRVKDIIKLKERWERKNERQD